MSIPNAERLNRGSHGINGFFAASASPQFTSFGGAVALLGMMRSGETDPVAEAHDRSHRKFNAEFPGSLHTLASPEKEPKGTKRNRVGDFCSFPSKPPELSHKTSRRIEGEESLGRGCRRVAADRAKAVEEAGVFPPDYCIPAYSYNYSGRAAVARQKLYYFCMIQT
jgi:hypothetical protein